MKPSTYLSLLPHPPTAHFRYRVRKICIMSATKSSSASSFVCFSIMRSNIRRRIPELNLHCVSMASISALPFSMNVKVSQKARRTFYLNAFIEVILPATPPPEDRASVCRSLILSWKITKEASTQKAPMEKVYRLKFFYNIL